MLRKPTDLTVSCFKEYLVPEEYVRTMRESMLNKCPVSSYEQVCEVFMKEVGEMPDKVCALLHTYLSCI